ncbi:hypothetical protein [Sandaracinus amylolyticus]|uniref:hypothetical protein n=1 Tax=Sandaracinus amylolyticus TaxID=927083 RepID=UPI001F1BECBA|nr:hypothetical protein [Sandaracinus amylolyticus]UJR83789.1 Hypothetical protein I5071_58600 [Sandaracinus amylolyticus]
MERVEETVSYVPSGAAPLTTINWRAILGGVVVALAVQILLTTLGLAIGATTVGASTDAGTARDAGIGVGIWYLVSNLISVFCGGLVAGISARETTRTLGAIEGMVVWALSLLLFIMFVTGGVQSLIGQASGMIMSEPSGMQMPQGLEDMGGGLSRREARDVATASTIAAWIAFGTLLLAAASGTIGGIVGARFNRRRLVVPRIGYRDEVPPIVGIHPREA